MTRAAGACLLLLLLQSTGCAHIPVGEPPPAAIGGAAKVPYRVCVAPISIELHPSEQGLTGDDEKYRVGQVVEEDDLRAVVASWLDPVFQRARPARGDTLDEALADAWRAQDQLVLELSVTKFRTEFDGHNGWWPLNVVNFLLWGFTAWFVATEEYSVSFDTQLVVRSADSNLVVHKSRLETRVEGTFGEFDRGWQLFGPLMPFNGPENWQTICKQLLPAAQAALGRSLAAECSGPLRARLEEPGLQDSLRKTMALVIGLPLYRDAVHYPPLPFAGTDTRAITRALLERCGLQARHVHELIGTDATRARVEQTLAEIGARSKPGDQLLVWFAGYGTRTRTGAPALLLFEAGADEGDVLPLEALAESLGSVTGRKLVVVDGGFDGQGRSIAGAAGSGKPTGLRAFQQAARTAGAALVLSARPEKDAVLTPEYLAAGLFGHHLRQGLQGAADLDGNGKITAGELFRFAQTRTAAGAEFFGATQIPTALGLDDEFALQLVGEETK